MAALLGWKTEGEKRRAESGCVLGEWAGPFWGLVEEEKEWTQGFDFGPELLRGYGCHLWKWGRPWLE